MQLLFWKRKNPQIDAFAQQLANYFFSTLPPVLARKAFAGETAGASRKAKPAARKQTPVANIERVIAEASARLRRFAGQYRLGLYGKARLHMQFRSRLTELGYSEDDARSIDNLVLFQGT